MKGGMTVGDTTRRSKSSTSRTSDDEDGPDVFMEGEITIEEDRVEIHGDLETDVDTTVDTLIVHNKIDCDDKRNYCP